MAGLRSEESAHPNSSIDPDNTSNEIVFDARFRHARQHGIIARSPLSILEREELDSAVLGLDYADYGSISEAFKARTEAAALELLDEPSFVVALENLPFGPGEQNIVAVGDSITDDSCSWAEILRAVFRLTDNRSTIVNHGISGDTTTGAITRLDLVEAEKPSWVFLMLGTNDARRHGATSEVRVVSLDETLRNIGSIQHLVANEISARMVTMTPPPVIEHRLRSWPNFVRLQLTWRAHDVAELAETLTSADGTVIDLHRAFSKASLRDLITADGVHPTLQGQQLILRELIAGLGGYGEL